MGISTGQDRTRTGETQGTTRHDTTGLNKRRIGQNRAQQNRMRIGAAAHATRLLARTRSYLPMVASPLPARWPVQVIGNLDSEPAKASSHATSVATAAVDANGRPGGDAQRWKGLKGKSEGAPSGHKEHKGISWPHSIV
ncbi:hypothetical protein ANO11243_025290 [Dothideomycetidae sp. 11243]|nr:hypothetical protein ANO11243_025290 [fungal sp. No.11243]